MSEDVLWVMYVADLLSDDGTKLNNFSTSSVGGHR